LKEETMTASAYLRPTTTQKIREFFMKVGEPVPPWTGVEDVMDHLWTVMYEKRDDAAFWKSLDGLVASLRSDLSNGDRGLPDEAAEILSAEKIGDLALRLQDAFRHTQGDRGRGAMRRFLKGLQAPLAGCLIVLGAAFAAGCEDETESTKTLQQYIDESSLSSPQKDALSTCLGRLTEDRKDELVRLFEDSTPEQIASTLEQMLASGGDCSIQDAGEDDAGTDPAQDPAGDDVEMIPIYKGVTF